MVIFNAAFIIYIIKKNIMYLSIISKKGNCLSNFILVFLIITITFEGVFAQEEHEVIIKGRIIDAENYNPLENAIIFLSNTPFGISSCKNGTFRIANIPVGSYEIIISRIGYEQNVIPLQVVKTESLYFEIKLRQRPVQIEETEVIAKHPEKLSSILFFPIESSKTYCVYGTASSIPIGILLTDSVLYMYCLEPIVIDSQKYIRLFLLFKNHSNTPVKFCPDNSVKLNLVGKKHSYKNIEPVSPSFILNKLQINETVATISNMVGKPLQIMAEQNIRFREEADRYFGDLGGIQGPKLRGLAPIILYDTFVMSKHEGILKSYLVYPDNSVNGYVYFPFPGLHWKATGTWFHEAAQYTYELEIITPNGSKKIEFRPY